MNNMTQENRNPRYKGMRIQKDGASVREGPEEPRKMGFG